MAPIDPFAVAIEPLRTCVESLVSDGRGVRERRQFEPARTSPAARDAARDEDFRGGLGRRPISDAGTGALMLCAAAEDHLLGLTAMLSMHHSPFAHNALARAALELSARSSYLLQLGIAPSERLARWTNERLYNLAETKTIAAEFAPAADARVQHILDAALAAGLQKAQAKRRRPPQLVPERQSATKLVARLMLDESQLGLGTLSYRMFSASTHGTIYALMGRTELLSRDESSGVATGHLTASAADVNTALASAMFGYTFLARDILNYYGWDEPDFVRSIDNATAIAAQQNRAYQSAQTSAG